MRIPLPPPATTASLLQETAASPRQPERAIPVPEPATERHSIESSGSSPPTNAMTTPPVLTTEEKPTVGSYPSEVVAFLQLNVHEESEHAVAEWLETTRTRLRVALRGYTLDAEIVGDRLTPNAALVQFKGTDRMTVAEVEKRREVLLTSHGLDVIAVRPEKGEVVVSVARDQRAILDLCAAWQRRALPSGAPGANTSFLLGEREVDGGLLYLNLGGAFGGQPQHGPHTLIAGETGGGKGVLTRNIILDICATNSPRTNDARTVMSK